MNVVDQRPLVTFALFAFNQARYVREAVAGVFAQDFHSMEIILSDDFSTDGTYEILQEMVRTYTGPHIVTARRNPKNLGLAEHFNAIVSLARGDILVVGAGDDISLPQRTAHAVAAFQRNANLAFVDCGLEEFDETGVRRIYQVWSKKKKLSLEDLLHNPKMGLVGAGRTYRRSSLARFPGLMPGCPTEDTTCVLRCLMSGEGLYAPDPLVRRRMHDANLSRPNGMKISAIAAIGAQYERDIEFAHGAGMIGNSQRTALHGKLRRLIADRILAQTRAEGRRFLDMVRMGVEFGGLNLGTLKSLAKAILR